MAVSISAPPELGGVNKTRSHGPGAGAGAGAGGVEVEVEVDLRGCFHLT